MNIRPVFTDMAETHHWVVRLLRFLGYVEVILATILGAFRFNVLSALISGQSYAVFNDPGASPLYALLGALLGFIAGMFLSLGTWAVALVIDDLHAIRIYLKSQAIDIPPSFYRSIRSNDGQETP